MFQEMFRTFLCIKLKLRDILYVCELNYFPYGLQIKKNIACILCLTDGFYDWNWNVNVRRGLMIISGTFLQIVFFLWIFRNECQIVCTLMFTLTELAGIFRLEPNKKLMMVVQLTLNLSLHYETSSFVICKSQ